MRLIHAIVLLLLACPAGAVNARYKIFSDGLGSAIVPHAVLYSTYNQTMVNAGAVQHLELNSAYHQYGFTQVTKSTWQVTSPGVYEFCFSGIADLLALPAATMEVWLMVDGVNMPDTNTITRVNSATTETIVSFCLFEQLGANSKFSFIGYGSDTDMQWLYTGPQTNPVRPAAPSILVSAKKIGGVE